MKSLYALCKEVWLLMYKRIIVLARKFSVCEEPVCTEQGSAALMYKRIIILARKYSVCEEPVCTEQGSAALM